MPTHRTRHTLCVLGALCGEQGFEINANSTCSLVPSLSHHSQSESSMKTLVALAFLMSLTAFPQTLKSGITGEVIQVGHPGPTRAGEPVYHYTGPIDVLRASDHQKVTTTSSDKAGRFTVLLPPGTYLITQSDPHLSRLGSKPIVVEKDKLTTVTLYADNGMR